MKQAALVFPVRLVLLALLLGTGVAARASDPYDMMITGSCYDSRWGAYGQFSGIVRDGTLQPFATYLNSLAEAPGGRVFGRRERELVEVLPDATVIPLTGYADPNTSYVSMVVGANGTIYLMQSFLDFPRILRILEPGKPLRAITVPAPHDIVGGIDLGADQCTLYYIDGYTTIKRFNVCTETPLPNFASAFSVQDVRVLPDGGALVAAHEAVLRFDAAGTLTRTYAVSDAQAIGLANGGTTAIVSHSCRPRLETTPPSAAEFDLERIDLRHRRHHHDPVRSLRRHGHRAVPRMDRRPRRVGREHRGAVAFIDDAGGARPRAGRDGDSANAVAFASLLFHNSRSRR